MNRRDKEAKKKDRRAKKSSMREARPPLRTFVTELRATIETTSKRATVDILAEGKTPAKVDELVANAVSYADTSAKAAMKAAPPPVPMACKAGCAYCCSLQVAITPPEVFALAFHLRKTKTASELTAITTRLQAIEEKTLGLSWQDRPPVPCALLDENNLCGAYEARPLSCRGWNSQNVDPCRRTAEGDKTAQTPVYEIPYMAHQSVMDGTRKGLEALHLESSETDLSIGLRMALGDPGLAARWLQGERVFERAYVKFAPPTRRLPVVA